MSRSRRTKTQAQLQYGELPRRERNSLSKIRSDYSGGGKLLSVQSRAIDYQTPYIARREVDRVVVRRERFAQDLLLHRDRALPRNARKGAFTAPVESSFPFVLRPDRGADRTRRGMCCPAAHVPSAALRGKLVSRALKRARASATIAEESGRLRRPRKVQTILLRRTEKGRKNGLVSRIESLLRTSSSTCVLDTGTKINVDGRDKKE